MLSNNDLERIVDILEAMGKAELVLAKFYSTCAQMAEKDRESFLDIEKDEIKHSDNIKKIINIIKADPEYFEPGRTFSSTAISTLISGIEDNIQLIKNGELSGNRLLFTARSIEQSLIENKFFEIVKGYHEEFMKLLKEIVEETRSHKQKLDKMIQQNDQD